MGYIRLFNYFSSHDSIARGDSINGLWTITHTAHVTILPSGKKIKTSAAGMNSVKNFTKHYKMDWVEMRRVFNLTMTSSANDPNILQRIKKRIINFIALRTGYLADMLFKSFKINRDSWYKSHYFMDFDYFYPPKRPRKIKNPRHSPPSQGYGDWSGYIPTEPIVVARVSIDHVTTGGNALYDLNDPSAVPNFELDLERISSEEIVKDYEEMVNNIQLVLHV